jgi:hypothetical protein
MASSVVTNSALTIDPPENTAEIAETLTYVINHSLFFYSFCSSREFESNSVAINADDETDELTPADVSFFILIQRYILFSCFF